MVKFNLRFSILFLYGRGIILTNKTNNPIPFWKKTWVSLIGAFVLLQIIFITLEAADWVSYLNLKAIDGTIFGKIVESSFFESWFTFYETTHFNLFTVFYGVVFLLIGIISAMKNMLFNKTV